MEPAFGTTAAEGEEKGVEAAEEGEQPVILPVLPDPWALPLTRLSQPPPSPTIPPPFSWLTPFPWLTWQGR